MEDESLCAYQSASFHSNQTGNTMSVRLRGIRIKTLLSTVLTPVYPVKRKEACTQERPSKLPGRLPVGVGVDQLRWQSPGMLRKLPKIIMASGFLNQTSTRIPMSHGPGIRPRPFVNY